MNTYGWTRRAMLAAATATLAFSGMAKADQMMDQVHFLIPGGAGGGWDGTARGTGEALVNAGLVGNATYENLSGGGGGVAIASLIENAASSDGTLMVNSTPIVIRALTGEIAQSFRDLTPVAGTVGDYAAIVVTADSPITSMVDGVRHFEVMDDECVGCNLCVNVCPVDDCITMVQMTEGSDPRTGRPIDNDYANWTTHPNNLMAKQAAE